MIKQERRKQILELLLQRESVQVSQLMEQFQVSIETIRRDLEELERQQQLVRVYGGAILPPGKAAEPIYRERATVNYLQKQAIGRLAADLVKDGDTIAIDLGTTTLALAKALGGKKNITVLTNSLKIAVLLAENPDIRVIVPGGEARRGDLALSGSLTTRILSEFNTDYAFLGVGGLSIEQGITDYHMEEAMARRVMVEHTRNAVALLDHSKLGVVAMNQVCPLHALDIVITDDGADPSVLSHLEKQKLKVLIAQILVE